MRNVLFLTLYTLVVAVNSGAADNLPSLQQEPQLIRSVNVRYPSSITRLGITGTVVLNLLLNERGMVDSVSVVSGLHPVLDSQIVNAVFQFKFTPAMVSGKPVPVIINYHYKITTDDLLKACNIQEYINFGGRVLERGTRRPVPDVEVIVSFSDSLADSSIPLPLSLYLQQIGQFSGQHYHNNSIFTFTDSSGRFIFKSLPKGPFHLKIMGPGYEPCSSSLLVAHKEAVNQVFRVNKSSYAENEIVVYGKEKSNEISKRSLSSAQINSIAGLNGDALKVVQVFPGVARPLFGSGSIGVRGAPSWDSRFFLDGIPVPQLYHFGGIKSVYNSEALYSVDLFPGGFGVSYGNSIAGVIALNSRNAERERVKGYADINLMDVSLFVEGPVNSRTGILASVRRSYLGNLLGLAVDKLSSIDIPVMIAPYYYDYLVRADVDLTPSQKLFFTLFGSRDALELIVSSANVGSTEVDAMVDRVSNTDAFNMVMVAHESAIREGWENSLRTALIQGLGNGLLLGVLKWDYKYYEFLLRNELRYTISPKISAKAGFDLWLKKYHQYAIFPTAERIFFRDTVNLISGLVSPQFQLEYNPFPALIVKSGLRYDYYPEIKQKASILPEFWNYNSFKNRTGLRAEPSLRFSASYQIHKKHLLTAALGTYNQTPQPLGFATHDTLGIPGVPVTKARQFMLGYNWQINDIISADLQLYHNQQWDLPMFTGMEDLLSLNSLRPVFEGDGRGKMYGLELFIRHNQEKNFSGWISYSLSKSKRYSNKEGKYIPYDNDQTHNLQCVLNYRFPRQWQAGTRVRLISGNPYTPVVDRTYDMTNRYFVPAFGEKNSLRNSPFFQLDLRVEKKFVFDNWLLTGYLDLQNLLWPFYKSPEITIYNYDYTRKTSLSVPIIPSIGVKADF
ncbi:MAG: TonB family protein [Fibrobacter sp.]|jgi:TonB family protein|nr:TonB family protein [Fibrobacter sp.]